MLAAIGFKKGELLMVPRTSFDRVFHRDPNDTHPATAEVHNAVGIDGGICKFSFTLPITATEASESKWRTGAVMEPYWWVGTTTDKTQANVAYTVHRDVQAQVSIPVLTNIKNIPKHGEVLILVPKPAKAQGAEAQANAVAKAATKDARLAAAQSKARATAAVVGPAPKRVCVKSGVNPDID